MTSAAGWVVGCVGWLARLAGLAGFCRMLMGREAIAIQRVAVRNWQSKEIPKSIRLPWEVWLDEVNRNSNSDVSNDDTIQAVCWKSLINSNGLRESFEALQEFQRQVHRDFAKGGRDLRKLAKEALRGGRQRYPSTGDLGGSR